MNLLDLIPGQYKRIGRKDGGEYSGPCPWCGDGGKGSDSDRFHVWPEQGKNGTYWCRMCGKAGDAIKYLMEHDSMEFKDAVAHLGRDLSEYASGSKPMPVGWRPSVATVPAGVWQTKALAFADYCHDRLVERPDELAWLAERGIGLDMVNKYRLGWNPSHAWREGSAWGVTMGQKTNGQTKKLWLPRGLVIPRFADFTGEAEVTRLRIRQPDGSPRYMVIPGSNREPLCSRGAEAMVVVESELDAILLDGVAGDLVGVVAMGNDSAKPTAMLLPHLEQALVILVALDSDTPRFNETTGRLEMAGGMSSRWWLEQFSQARRLPVVGGKDPGEAFAAGVDLRAWVLAALPPYFRVKSELEAARIAHTEQIAVNTGAGMGEEANDEQEASSGEPDAVLPESDSVNVASQQSAAAVTPPAVCEVTLPDGRVIYTTGDRKEWDRLVAEGKVVFSLWEMERMQQAMVAMSLAERTTFVSEVVDIKQVFGHAWIGRGAVVVDEVQAVSEDEPVEIEVTV